MVNKSNNEIIETLKKHKALTQTELSKLLGYSRLNERLRRLAKKGLVQYTKIPGNRGKYKFFRGYNGIKLYYIEKEHLKEWIEMKLPERMPPIMHRIASRCIYSNFGIRVS